MAEHLTITPAGFTILHEDGEPDPVTGKSKRRSYTVARLPEADFSGTSDQEFLRFARENGEKFVAVTTALGVVEKPGLQWAAERLTVEGCIKLARDGGLPTNVDGALSRLRARELRFRQIWDAKAKRGTLTHEDLVSVVTGGELRPLDSYAPEERGMIRGVSAWTADWRPQVRDHELMVASVEHGVAGRLDLRAETFKLPGLGLWDLKTTEELPRDKRGNVKPPYDEHLWQLGAYEMLARESGYGESSYQALVRVDASGAYDVSVSWVGPEGFLAALQLYRAKRHTSATRPKDRTKVAA